MGVGNRMQEVRVRKCGHGGEHQNAPPGGAFECQPLSPAPPPGSLAAAQPSPPWGRETLGGSGPASPSPSQAWSLKNGVRPPHPGLICPSPPCPGPSLSHSQLLAQAPQLGLGVGQLQGQVVRGALQRGPSRSLRQQRGWLSFQQQLSQPLWEIKGQRSEVTHLMPPKAATNHQKVTLERAALLAHGPQTHPHTWASTPSPLTPGSPGSSHSSTGPSEPRLPLPGPPRRAPVPVSTVPPSGSGTASPALEVPALRAQARPTPAPRPPQAGSPGWGGRADQPTKSGPGCPQTVPAQSRTSWMAAASSLWTSRLRPWMCRMKSSRCSHCRGTSGRG